MRGLQLFRSFRDPCRISVAKTLPFISLGPYCHSDRHTCVAQMVEVEWLVNAMVPSYRVWLCRSKCLLG